MCVSRLQSAELINCFFLFWWLCPECTSTHAEVSFVRYHQLPRLSLTHLMQCWTMNCCDVSTGSLIQKAQSLSFGFSWVNTKIDFHSSVILHALYAQVMKEMHAHLGRPNSSWMQDRVTNKLPSCWEATALTAALCLFSFFFKLNEFQLFLPPWVNNEPVLLSHFFSVTS